MNNNDCSKLSRRYCLINKPDGIYLKVTTDNKLLFSLKIHDILSHLQRERIPFDSSIVEKCFKAADGEERKISPQVQGLVMRTYLNMKITPNKMKVYLLVIPFINGKKLVLNDIKAILKENNISFGIKNNIFDQVLSKQDEYNEYLIAEGISSEQGENAKLNYNFNTRGLDIKPKELEDGSVDFYNLNLIQVVSSGTILVEKKPPTRGKNGMNVFGEELPAAAGKDVRLPMGKNTQAIDEYSKLVATKEGHVILIKDKVNVLNSYEVKSDVDFNTGNISYPGNVFVRGNVKTNFIVEADGDVEIYGNVEGTVKSKNNVYIKNGIVRGEVYADGCIYVRYIENSSVQCGDELFVNEAIMHSTVKAGKKISLGGRKGLIVGGKSTAGEEIFAKNVGSTMGTATTLEVGIPPELRLEYQDTTKKLIKLKQDYDKSQKALRMLQSIKEKVGELPDDKKVLHLKISRLIYQYKYDIETFKNRLIELDEQFEEMRKASISVEKIIYTGVNINIGKALYSNIEEKTNVRFKLDGLDIKYYPLRER